MKRMAILGAVAAMTAGSSALAQNSGYAHFGAVSDTIRINGNTVFNSGDYTYELRVRVANGSPLGNVITEQRNALEDKAMALSSGQYACSVCGSTTGDFAGSIVPPIGGRWIHLTYVRSGSALRLYIDGSIVDSRIASFCFGDIPYSVMSLGMFTYNVECCPTTYPSFLGDLDWIRISAGARYTTNFTPPLECDVISDASTQLLLKFNEPAGTATLVDESPNHFICDVGVPVYPGVTATSPTLGNTIDGFPACRPPCDGDITHNGTVDGVDLALILATWGTNGAQGGLYCDVNHDGIVNGSDLAIVLGAWGPCP